jgi:hypothetical protein
VLLCVYNNHSNGGLRTICSELLAAVRCDFKTVVFSTAWAFTWWLLR